MATEHDDSSSYTRILAEAIDDYNEAVKTGYGKAIRIEAAENRIARVERAGGVSLAERLAEANIREKLKQFEDLLAECDSNM